MGVDIATYRCRIGCFGGNFGSDVLTVMLCLRFNDWLKAVGSVMFIGTLLLIAGIEPNPGPLPGRQEKTETPAFVVCDISCKRKTADQCPDILSPAIELTTTRSLETTDARLPGRKNGLRKRKIYTVDDQERENGKIKRLKKMDSGTSPPNISSDILNEHGTVKLPLLDEKPSSSAMTGSSLGDEFLEDMTVRKHTDRAFKRSKCKRLKSSCLKTVKTYLVPADCFSRYEYAIENIEDIFKRYNKCFLKHHNGCIQKEKISIHICKGVEEPWIPLKDVLLNNDRADDINMVCKRKGTIKRLMQTSRKEMSTSVIITGEQQQNLIEWGAKNALGVVVVAANRSEKRAVSRRYNFCFKQNIVVTTLPSAAEDLCNFLERLAFSKVKGACEDIYNHLEQEWFALQNSALATSLEGKETFVQYRTEADNAGNSDRAGTKKLSGQTNTDPNNNTKSISTGDKRKRKAILENTFQETHKLRKNVASKRNITRLCNANQVVSDETSKKPFATDHINGKVKGSSHNSQGLFAPYMIDESYLQHTDVSIKESLLEEILALYKSSNVPRRGWPDIPRQKDRKVPKQVCKRIFRSCPTVKGLGYRFNTLQVVVEEKTSEESVYSIENLLQQMKLDKYVIETISMQEFSSVGSEIYVDNPTTSGSLGGFATMKATSEMRSCVLLSKHVAVAGKGKEGRDGKVVAKEGDRLLGYVIQDTVKERGYDIAAARLDVDVATCDTSLKNSKGKAMKGSSKGKATLKGSLRGRKVHLWGAKSKPGKGVVTVPYYTMDGMDEHLIQVEDLLDGEQHIPKRFAEPGDSGAIACADDPSQAFVHPVSMNVGLLNYTEIENDNKNDIKTKRGKYLTVPLAAGLEQLGTRTESTFDLITD